MKGKIIYGRSEVGRWKALVTPRCPQNLFLSIFMAQRLSTIRVCAVNYRSALWCENNTNAVAQSACLNISLPDFVHSCGEGRVMSPDSKDCTDKDECLDLPCLNGGTCINLEPKFRYRCDCTDGYRGKIAK
ncbi:hypothetical protein NQ317_001462 [Molorchus minor]|uniref:EGF-like domain-containing protein n=1 Tax=Molorchus minor TaxID=1323400 RepID=A0ABQ9IUD9_9CUCU|nr:hypothetical protein NQ317_001462 [Molorchus minor]